MTGGDVEYRKLVAIARREGRSLPAIAAAWRGANMRLHGSPVDPQRRERLARDNRVGGYLSDGVSFRRALELASRSRNPENPSTSAAVKCQACGLPTRRPVKVEASSTLERLRGKVVCQTCLAREGNRVVRNPRRRNPASSTNWTPLLAIGAALAFFAWRSRGGASVGIAPLSAAPAPAQLPAMPTLIPYQAWWVKYRNGGLGAPITTVFPDTFVYDTPDGGMIGLPIPPAIQ